MNSMIILVRLRQLFFPKKQRVEPLALTQFEILVHLNRFERANFDTDLAAHANRDVDVEHLRIKLRLAHVIGLLVVTLNNIDGLRRALLLTNLARHAAQAGFGIIRVIDENRKVPLVFRQRISLLRILHRDQTVLLEITSGKIPERDRHSL